MNKSLTPPCKDCENRKPLCHGDCEGYLNFKKNKAQVSEARTAYMNNKSIAVQSVKRTKGQKWV
ncbi:hypothetical protein [Clostridium saccharoperbutylacetonicum]|uniref:hypothetical protein n=1 Tax=Clostridium saccharoperbutylacetonicum TaxID=36745 RepID=UPI0039EC72A8